MRLFRRPRTVTADIHEGFWCAEADALQRTIVTSLRSAAGSSSGIPVDLELTPGVQGRIVVSWRRRIVGFVPAAHARELSNQLSAAAPAPLVSHGEVVLYAGLWRIWVGPPWPEMTAPPDLPVDEMAPPPLSILGVPLRGRNRGEPAAAEPLPAEAATDWLLSVGVQSWDIRDGVDLDVALLRSRVAAAASGDVLHVRVGEERVTISLDSATRVTLQPLRGGAVEVLHNGSDC